MEHEIKTTRARAIIRGRVQGVFYRASTESAVREIGGITGWVRNRPDGSVEAVFEGEEQAVIRILEWCKTGSPAADVSAVEVEWERPAGAETDFRVRY